MCCFSEFKALVIIAQLLVYVREEQQKKGLDATAV